MSNFLSGLISGALPVAVTAVTGASGTTVGGNALPMNDVEIGSLSALTYLQATTSTLTLAPKWQVSADGSTWRDAKLPNNAANVVLVTGTGSAVAATVAVSAPDAVYGWAYARIALVTGGTTASTGDEYSFSYNYLKRGSVPR